jgi:type IV pilus modification protein PilV
MPKHGDVKMKRMNLLRNQEGTTLVEAMVAIAVLTVGLLGVMAAQSKGIDFSSVAMHRTNANNMAISLLETLKELPFNDPNLAQTNATANEINALFQDSRTSQQLQLLINANRVRTYVAIPSSLPRMAPLIFAAPTPGTIVDQSDGTYQLAWDVKDNLVGADVLDKTIRIFMTWRNNSTGLLNRLEMTTVKYNNMSL